MGLKTTGSRPPLFCIASPEVNAVGYALLTRHLDDDQPVYVLQTPPADDALRRLSPREIPELATTYLAEVRKIQPHGPYRLLGMCVGAQLVLEMARQLDDNGEQATFAGVINTWALFTISRRYRLQQVFNTFGWYGRRLRQIIALPPREQLPTIGSMIRRRVGGLLPQPAPGNLESSPRSGENNAEPPPPALAPSGSSDGERRWRRDPWIEEYGWSEKDPGDRKYAGEITVFRQRFQPFWRTGDRDLGWGRHAERTNVVPLPGLNHLGILREPVVRVVAKKLTEQLDTAHEKDIR